MLAPARQRNNRLSLRFTADDTSAMAAHEVRKVTKRKKAFLESALSSRGVRDDEKMRRRLGSAMRLCATHSTIDVRSMLDTDCQRVTADDRMLSGRREREEAIGRMMVFWWTS